jgi:arylsulfatase A-like enzyme
MCEHIDHEVGRILQALEETGQADDTLVIFMSDHGEMLGDHGIYFKGPHFYDEAIRVPLVMRLPGVFEGGKTRDGFVELIDLAPTILEVAGIEAPRDRLQGHSLVNETAEREFVFCEYYNSWTHPDAYGTMIRTREEKLVVYHGTGQGEYYDLRSDPDEFENRFSDPTASDAVRRLMQQCFDASVFTMDPGPVRKGPF